MYLRQSFDRYGDELALSRQLEDCKSLAKHLGLTITRTYQDNDLSASKRDVVRPEYDRMVADYEAGKFDTLICWDLDRLTRQPRQLEDWIDRAEGNGLRLVTANGEADLSTDGGRMYARIKAAVAKAEIERKSRRQALRYAQDARRGVHHWTTRPFGYELDGSLREDEAAAIRQAFEDTLNGMGRTEIARRWNDQGFRGPKDGKPWTAPGIRFQLLSPRNAGLRTYKPATASKDAEPEVIGRGDWEPIVSEEKWRGVRAMLLGVKSLRPGGREVLCLLSGIATCGKCGGVIKGAAKDPQGRERYTCHSGRCVYVLREETDAYVWGQVVMHLLPARREAWKGRTTDDSARASLNAQLAVLDAREAELGTAFATGALSIVQVTAATEAIRQQRAGLDDQLGQLLADFRPVLDLPDATGSTFTYLTPSAALYPPAGLTLSQCRATLRGLADVAILPAANKGRQAKPYDPSERVRLTPVDTVGTLSESA
jgi:DNA invertase Pin-like site-specific DNA recombinase